MKNREIIPAVTITTHLTKAIGKTNPIAAGTNIVKEYPYTARNLMNPGAPTFLTAEHLNIMWRNIGTPNKYVNKVPAQLETQFMSIVWISSPVTRDSNQWAKWATIAIVVISVAIIQKGP